MSSLPYDASIFMISCCLSLFLGATVSQNWEHKIFCKYLIHILDALYAVLVLHSCSPTYFCQHVKGYIVSSSMASDLIGRDRVNPDKI